MNNRPFKGGSSRRRFGSPQHFRYKRPSNNRGAGSSRRGFKITSFFDPNMFINKAVIQEETSHFTPEHKFTDFHIDDRLKANITRRGFENPTPIQDRSIPYILQGRDVVGIANTGTGKTAAFLIPLIDKVLKNPKERILIVVPTRELAVQIDQELKGFVPAMGIFSVCAVGGISIVPQIRDLKHLNQFVIGTPGRIKDLIERKALDLSRTHSVVLDEADRMLDMGFIADMRFLMGKMPKPRHTLFFSATMSKEIEGLIHEFLNDPVSISVKTRDTSKNIDQDVVRIERGQDKLDVLELLLKQAEFKKVLVFGRTKHGVEKIARNLHKRGIPAESIHGNKTHGQRQKALGNFKDNTTRVLIATDVAARGLDIPAVSHVINFDLPATRDDYVHRIGRTGRGSHKGKALTFIES